MSIAALSTPSAAASVHAVGTRTKRDIVDETSGPIVLMPMSFAVSGRPDPPYAAAGR
ncbi:MAG: hypothetical protein ACRDQE_05710 [Gaiellales bacterium]